jgi:hypothetical protein
VVVAASDLLRSQQNERDRQRVVDEKRQRETADQRQTRHMLETCVFSFLSFQCNQTEPQQRVAAYS